MSLDKKQKQHYRIQAHKLKPIVMIGNKGLTDAVKKEVAIALRDHELIKIRIASTDREERRQMFAEICESEDAEPVQFIGGIGVLYKKKEEE